MTQWKSITAAITKALGPEKDSGRNGLLTCWSVTSEQDHAQRCVIAHYLADLQVDLADEVLWDERALIEHPFVQDADLASVGIARARSLAPSLHLNLGDGYLRQGRMNEAEVQLALGRKHLDALGDDGYGRLIRNGLQRLAEQIEGAAAR